MDINELEQYVKHCNRCELCNNRTNTVLGDGNIRSQIMIIGEGPGEQEDLTGIAFVGKAGQLLDRMLKAINLDRKQVYICNIVKCRPPKNRNPKPAEIENCLDYLRMQYKIMQPKAVLLLGSIACKTIIGDDFSIMKSHGEIFEKKGIKFLATFHPSALLRDESKKALAWEDLKKFRQLLIENNLLAN